MVLTAHTAYTAHAWLDCASGWVLTYDSTSANSATASCQACGTGAITVQYGNTIAEQCACPPNTYGKPSPLGACAACPLSTTAPAYVAVRPGEAPPPAIAAQTTVRSTRLRSDKIHLCAWRACPCMPLHVINAANQCGSRLGCNIPYRVKDS
jgi:hypothetical protein